jgi:hypothetical protein
MHNGELMSRTSKAEEYMAMVEEKIRSLLREFSEGKLNSNQFHMLYERYSSQRLVAQQAILTGDVTVLKDTEPTESTIAVKAQHMGKAQGLAIYHNMTGAVIETLGQFDLSAFIVSPILADLRQHLADEAVLRPRAQRMQDQRWLVYAAQPQTSVIVLFLNEPSPLQMREIQRLHQDFETANETFLQQPILDVKHMVYPFNSFVQRKKNR